MSQKIFLQAQYGHFFGNQLFVGIPTKLHVNNEIHCIRSALYECSETTVLTEIDYTLTSSVDFQNIGELSVNDTIDCFFERL